MHIFLFYYKSIKGGVSLKSLAYANLDEFRHDSENARSKTDWSRFFELWKDEAVFRLCQPSQEKTPPFIL